MGEATENGGRRYGRGWGCPGKGCALQTLPSAPVSSTPTLPDGCCCFRCFFRSYRAAVAAGAAARAGGAVFCGAGLRLLRADCIRGQVAGPARYRAVSGRGPGSAELGRRPWRPRAAVDQFHVFGDANLFDFGPFPRRPVRVPAKGPHPGPAFGGGQSVFGIALRLRAGRGPGLAAAGGGGGRGGAGLFELQLGHSAGRAQHQVVCLGLRAAGAGWATGNLPAR